MTLRELLTMLVLIAAVAVVFYIAMLIQVRPATAQWWGWPPATYSDPYQQPPHVITSSRHHVATPKRHHVVTPSRHHVVTLGTGTEKGTKRAVSVPVLSQDAERDAIHDRVLSFCRRFPKDGACQKEPEP